MRSHVGRGADDLFELYSPKNTMDIKYFKIIEGKHYYWEARKVNEENVLFHYGILGTQGKTDRIKTDYPENADSLIKKEVAEKTKIGFKPFPNEDYLSVIIHLRAWGIFGLSNENSRKSTETLMNNQLSWYGYGFCDGGKTIGNDYNLHCRVINDKRAIKLIKRSMRFSRFIYFRGITVNDLDK